MPYTDSTTRSWAAGAATAKAPSRARAYRHDGNELTVMSWFCGAGGDTQGADAVPNVRVTRAANHWDVALATHAWNNPLCEVWKGDIRRAPVERWPVCDIFWASPECPKWSAARGVKRDFDKTLQGQIDFDEPEFKSDKERRAAEERSRALMEEVPMYLRGVIARGGLVKAGVVENVIDCRDWDDWDRWMAEFDKMGYDTKVCAINSMHVDPRSLDHIPQSRDRLYVAYWHRSLGRTPQWDKWVLRPEAFCFDCDEMVEAIQVFRKPGKDMGRYRQSYDYRCPRKTCRAIVEPMVLPAAAAIDWSLPGTPIGDRPKTADCPEGLAPATIARTRAGFAQYWGWGAQEAGGQDALFGGTDDTPQAAPGPMLVPTGGTWRDKAVTLDRPMSTRTTVETDGIVVPPILVPCEGRDGKKPMSVDDPLRTQTARLETALAYLPPFVVPMRGGGDKEKARHISAPLHTVSAGGNHHGLVTAPDHLLVPYYGNGRARQLSEPIGALPTRDRYALVKGEFNIDDVLFRMLQPHEIARAMAFRAGYKIMGSKRHQVRQLGNAVTPGVAENLYCALVEAITGEELSRFAEGRGPLSMALAA